MPEPDASPVSDGIDHLILLQRLQLDTVKPIRFPHVEYTAETAARFFREYLVRHAAHEVYMGLCLDVRGKMRQVVYIGYGGPGGAPGRYDEAIAIPIVARRTRFVLLHNHVDNSLYPSALDLKITRDVAELATRVRKVLVDHVIVGNDFGWISLRDKGFLS
jgi:DNA repair protein RadC